MIEKERLYAKAGSSGDGSKTINETMSCVPNGPQGLGQESTWDMLKLILDTIPQPVFWKDQNFVFRGCNAAFSTETGCSQQAIIGKTDFELSNETTAKKYRAEDEQVIQSGCPLIDYETLQIVQSGEQKWESVSKLPLRDADGNIIGVLGMLRDITQQKQAEGALRASEALFSAAFERSASGMSLTDAGNGCFLQANEALCDMLGYRPEELRSKTFQGLAHPDDLGSDRDRLDRLMAGEVNTALVEKRYLDKDGDDVWMLVSAAMIRDKQDKPLYVISQVQDISEHKLAEAALKESDERLNILFDCAPDAYFLLDHNGIFIDGNQAAEKLTGYHRLELFRNNFSDVNLLSKADMRTMEKCLADVTRNKVAGPDEFTLTRRDGTKVPIEMRSFLVSIQDFPVVLSIARDTSERKEAESRLADLHQQLLQHSRQSGRAEVATTVLHDVGNVLNSINVSSSLVAEKVRKSRLGSLPQVVALLNEHGNDLAGFFTDTPKGKQLPGYLDRLSDQLAEEQRVIIDELVLLGNNIEHVKEIISMQQAYTKISSVSEVTDVKELMEDCLRMSQPALKRHGVEVLRDYAPVPAFEVEKHKLMQVIVNLIQNAKDACAGSGTEDRQLKLVVGRDQDCVRISVIDNGIGIEADNLAQVFNYGFTTRADGNGFGLYSSVLAAQEMGGSLTVHSDGPGHGATFTLELPFDPEQSLHE